MRSKNNTVMPSYQNCYFVAGALYVAVFAICVALFSFVTYEASGIILNITRAIAYVSAFAAAVLMCARCEKANKINNPDIFTPPRNLIYYVKRMGYAAITIVLANLVASFLGGFAIGLVGSFLFGMDNLFVRDFIFKLPAFAIYLVIVYRFFAGYGVKDCQRKIYNLSFRMFTVAIACLTLLPGAIYDNFFVMSATNKIYLNVQSVFGPNDGIYFIDEDRYSALNENFNGFNVFLIIATVILAFAAQMAVAYFAYENGRKAFVKEQIRKSDENDFFENI